MDSLYRFELGKYVVGKLRYNLLENGEFFDGYEEERVPGSPKVSKLNYFFRFGPSQILNGQVSVGFMSEYVLKQVGYQTNGRNMCIVYQAPYNYQNLHDYVMNHEGPLPEEDVISFMFMIIRYICDLKENRFLSSAISPENIFLFHQGSNKKLLRFLGSSNDFELKINSSFVRPVQFYTPCISPEIACGGGGRIDSKSDVFSFGAISYFLMTKQYPFGNDKDPKVTIGAIKKHDGHFNRQITGTYDNKLKNIVERCLNGQESERPKPHDILKLPILNRLPYDNFNLLIYVTPSIEWKPRRDIYAEDNSTYTTLLITSKVKNSVSKEGVVIEPEVIDYATATQESYTVPYNWVIPCTATTDRHMIQKQFLFGGVFPLFEDCQILGGPQWDTDELGNNNQYFPGRVVSVLPNNDQFNLVTVEWPSVDRFYRYKYGGGEDRFEIIPAFPPLYHGLHVISRKSYKGTPFKGVVHTILPGRRKFKIDTGNGNLIEVSYGEEFHDNSINGGEGATIYRFDVEIDNNFHKINYDRCKSVDEFLDLVLMKYSPINPNPDDPSKNPKEKILEEFKKYQHNKPRNLQAGYFVRNTTKNAPPHDFYRVIDSSSDPVVNRYFNNSVVQEILKSDEGLVQCSYGDSRRHPPLCIGNTVQVNADGSEGKVERICSDPGQPNKTWEYLIVKMTRDRFYKCFKYNELTLVNRGK